MAKYTKQTPEDLTQWLDSYELAFPQQWSLNEVVDECRRRYLSGRGGLGDDRFVVHWAAMKLATERTFSACHWEWIAGGSHMPSLGFYSRLFRVLEPAFPQGPGWRTTDAERSELLREIGNKARDLLRILETERRIDVGLSEVVGLYPTMRPLLDLESEINQRRMRQVQAWSMAKRDGTDYELPAPEHPNFFAPHLSDYLQALLAKLLGKGRRAYPKISFPDEADGDEPSDDEDDDHDIYEALMDHVLFPTSGQPLDPELVRSGGDFGKYPARSDSLLSAVIKAFPPAIYERITEAPSCTVASLIEAACTAWFGDSPSQSEINKRTKEQRHELEQTMRRAINGRVKVEALEAKLRAEGRLPSEIRSRLLQDFLDDD